MSHGTTYIIGRKLVMCYFKYLSKRVLVDGGESLKQLRYIGIGFRDYFALLKKKTAHEKKIVKRQQDQKKIWFRFVAT